MNDEISVEDLKQMYPNMQIHNEGNMNSVRTVDAAYLQQMGLSVPISQEESTGQFQQAAGIKSVGYIKQVESEGRQGIFVLPSYQQVIIGPPHFIINKTQSPQLAMTHSSPPQLVEHQLQKCGLQFSDLQKQNVQAPQQNSSMPVQIQKHHVAAHRQQLQVYAGAKQSMSQQNYAVHHRSETPTIQQHSAAGENNQVPQKNETSVQTEIVSPAGMPTEVPSQLQDPETNLPPSCSSQYAESQTTPQQQQTSTTMEATVNESIQRNFQPRAMVDVGQTVNLVPQQNSGNDKFIYLPADGKLAQPPRIIYFPDGKSLRGAPAQFVRTCVKTPLRLARPQLPQQTAVKEEKPHAQYRPKKVSQQSQPPLPWKPTIRASAPPMKMDSPIKMQSGLSNVVNMKSGGAYDTSKGQKSTSSSSDEHQTSDSFDQLVKTAVDGVDGPVFRYVNSGSVGKEQQPIRLTLQGKAHGRPPKPLKEPKPRKPREKKSMAKEKKGATLCHLLLPGGSNSKGLPISVAQFLQTVGVEGAENAYADIQQPSLTLTKESDQQADNSQASKNPAPKVPQQVRSSIQLNFASTAIRSNVPRILRPVILPVLNTPTSKSEQSPVRFATPHSQSAQTIVQQASPKSVASPSSSTVTTPLRLPQIGLNTVEVRQSIQQRYQKAVGVSIRHPEPKLVQAQPGTGIVQDGQSRLHPGSQVLKASLVRSMPPSSEGSSPVVKSMQADEVTPVEEAPRCIPGLMALCPFCGISSQDFNKCYRCRRKLPENCKVVRADSTAKPAVDRQFDDKEQEVEKKKPKVSLRKKKVEEPEILVLSSDDEYSKNPDEESCYQFSVVDKEPLYGPEDVRDIFNASVNIDSELDSYDGQYTTMVNEYCRIGNFNSEHRDRVSISTKGIRFVVLSPEDNSVTPINLKWSDLKKLLMHYSRTNPVCFLYPTMPAVNAIRKKLGMEDFGFPYQYEPCSDVQAYKRIIIVFEKVTDENKLVIRNLGYTSILDEIDEDTAAVLLDLSNTPVPKLSSSNPETRQILTFYKTPITIADYTTLTGDQYLNDTIINFYLKYLMERVLSPEDRERTFLFETYFYSSLTSKASAKQNSSERKLSRWFKETNPFEKDFIIVPINENSHWFLAIICFPSLLHPVTFDEGKPVDEPVITRKAATSKKVLPCLQIGQTTITQCKSENGSARTNITISESEQEDDDDLNEDEDESDSEVPPSPPSIPLLGAEPEVSKPLSKKVKPARVPIKQACILIFDSLKGSGSRSKIVVKLRDFLRDEYKDKFGKTREFNRDNCKGSVLNVPQQTNYTDCGLYLLQYVESFFSAPLRDYRLPIKYLEDWFTEDHMRNKRGDVAAVIQNLIIQDGRNPQSLNLPLIGPMDYSDDQRETEEADDEEEDDDDDDDDMESSEIDHDEHYEDDEDDYEAFDCLEPGEVRRSIVNQTESVEAQKLNDIKMIKAFVEQSRASPVSEQTRRSLKNIRIQRPDRSSEPSAKKAKDID